MANSGVFARPVMVVEDDPDVREAVSLALTDHGRAVVTASHGKEAIEQLCDGLRPSVILLDLMMPEVTGNDVIRFVRASDSLRDLRIVVMTASLRVDVPPDIDVMRKPLDLRTLLDRVQHHWPL